MTAYGLSLCVHGANAKGYSPKTPTGPATAPGRLQADIKEVMMSAWLKKLGTVLLPIIMMLALLIPTSALAADPPASPPFGYWQDDFCKIATHGLDNAMNNYAWSMAYFNGSLYVGTGRNNPYMLNQELNILPELPGMTEPHGAPGTLQWANDERAEIWRYRGGVWKKVYQSPILNLGGQYVPREWGLRDMAVFTDCNGEEALYASSRGITAGPGYLLLKSTDGLNWQQVPTPPEMGGQSRALLVNNGKLYVGTGADLVGPGRSQIWVSDCPTSAANWSLVADFTTLDAGNNATPCLTEFNGNIYAGTQNTDSGYQVFRSIVADPTDPNTDWQLVVQYGGGDEANYWAGTMHPFNGKLYVGSMSLPLETAKGFEVIRIATDDTYELVIGDTTPFKAPPGPPVARTPVSGWPAGFGNILNLYCWSMEERDGVLYLGTFDATTILGRVIEEYGVGNLLDALNLSPAIRSGIADGIQQMIPVLQANGVPTDILGMYDQLAAAIESGVTQAILDALILFGAADMWKTPEGTLWLPVTLDGFNNADNYGIRNILSADSLYVGTANPFTGLEVLKICPTAPTTPPAEVVGIEVMSVNKVALIAPWLAGFAAMLAVAGIFASLRRAKALRHR